MKEYGSEILKMWGIRVSQSQQSNSPNSQVLQPKCQFSVKEYGSEIGSLLRGVGKEPSSSQLGLQVDENF